MASSPATAEVQRPPEEDEGGRWWQSPIARMVWKRGAAGGLHAGLDRGHRLLRDDRPPGRRGDRDPRTTRDAGPDRETEARTGPRRTAADSASWHWAANAIQRSTSATRWRRCPGQVARRPSQQPVTSLVNERILNSVGADRRHRDRLDRARDPGRHVRRLPPRRLLRHRSARSLALVASALPEFVVAIFVRDALRRRTSSTWFPAISVLPPGDSILERTGKAGAAGAGAGDRRHPLHVPDDPRGDDRGARLRLRRVRPAEGRLDVAGSPSATRCRTRSPRSSRSSG